MTFSPFNSGFHGKFTFHGMYNNFIAIKRLWQTFFSISAKKRAVRRVFCLITRNYFRFLDRLLPNRTFPVDNIAKNEVIVAHQGANAGVYLYSVPFWNNKIVAIRVSMNVTTLAPMKA
jgi:hypothetical protein